MKFLIKKAGLPFYYNKTLGIDDATLFEISSSKRSLCYPRTALKDSDINDNNLTLVFFLIYRDGCFENVGFRF